MFLTAQDISAVVLTKFFLRLNSQIAMPLGFVPRFEPDVLDHYGQYSNNKIRFWQYYNIVYIKRIEIRQRVTSHVFDVEDAVAALASFSF